jgi:hypothetical protein
MGKRKYALPPEIDPWFIEYLENHFQLTFTQVVTEMAKTGKYVGGKFYYDMTPEAREKHQEWYITRPKEMGSHRLNVYFMRLMPLIAFNDGKPEIDLETVEKVIDLMDYELKVRRICHPILADNIATRMFNAILRNLRNGGKKGLSIGQLHNLCGVRRHGYNPFYTAMKWLLAENFIEEYEGKKALYYKLIKEEESETD